MLYIAGIFSLKIKYTSSRGVLTYYQRPVPTDLQARYGRKTIKQNLKTNDPRVIAREIERLNREVEAEWALCVQIPAPALKP